MVQLVLVAQAAQDRDGVLDRRFADHDGLEAALERGILLDILAVFVERRRADAVQLAAGERGFQQVRRVHRAFALASADELVDLVDEHQHVGPVGPHLVEHRLQPLLELAAVFRARNERAHVEAHQPLALDAVGDVAVGDAEREALDDRRLADAGLADQHRVVLGPAGEHLDRPADLLVAADDRIELAVARRLRQVAGVFLQRVEARFGVGAVGGAALAGGIDRHVEAGRGDAACRQCLAGGGRRGERDRHQDALDGDEAVLRLGRDLLGRIEDADGVVVPRDVLRAGARHLGNLGQREIGRLDCRRRIAAGGADQVGGEPLVVVEQRLEQMLGGDPLMVLADRDGLRRLEKTLRAVGEFLDVHVLSLPAIWCGFTATQGGRLDRKHGRRRGPGTMSRRHENRRGAGMVPSRR